MTKIICSLQYILRKHYHPNINVITETGYKRKGKHLIEVVYDIALLRVSSYCFLNYKEADAIQKITALVLTHPESIYLYASHIDKT